MPLVSIQLGEGKTSTRSAVIAGSSIFHLGNSFWKEVAGRERYEAVRRYVAVLVHAESHHGAKIPSTHVKNLVAFSVQQPLVIPPLGSKLFLGSSARKDS